MNEMVQKSADSSRFIVEADKRLHRALRKSLMLFVKAILNTIVGANYYAFIQEYISKATDLKKHV